MDKEIRDSIIREVWGPKIPKDVIGDSFRECLAKHAMEICHETGDPDTWVVLCADTIIQFLASDD